VVVWVFVLKKYSATEGTENTEGGDKKQSFLSELCVLCGKFALLGMSLNNRSLCTLKMSQKLYPHLPDHKLETVSRYLLGESCEQMQMHRALDDAKLAGMIFIEMGKM